MKLCMGCMAELKDQESVCPHCGYAQGTAAQESYYLNPGTVLNARYIVGKVLGYGGFGVTYIGYDTLLKRVTAIKEYFPSNFATRSMNSRRMTIYSGDAYEQFRDGLESFISEARRLANLNHVEGIVRIYDCIRDNDTGYIIMEFLKGQTVKEILKRREKYDCKEAQKVIFPVMDALREVHRAGIIHRDIAPDNIFITEEGEVKLLDFGAARYAASSKSRSLSVILKAGYAPEEQYRSHGKQGPWTDIYALGATFYRMITGVRPEDSIERMVEDDLQPPSALGADTSPQQDDAVMKSLSIKMEERYQNVEEFKDALLLAEAGKEREERARMAACADTCSEEEVGDIHQEKPQEQFQASTLSQSGEGGGRKKKGVFVGIAAAAVLAVILLAKKNGLDKKDEVPAIAGQMKESSVSMERQQENTIVRREEENTGIQTGRQAEIQTEPETEAQTERQTEPGKEDKMQTGRGENAVTIDRTSFPDEEFRWFVRTLDSDNDKELSEEERLAIRKIDVSGKKIGSLQGIELFPNLETLICSNCSLTSLDLSGNLNLKMLNCEYNQLSSLNVGENSSIEEIRCGNNCLTSLNVAENTALRRLTCHSNQLEELDLQYNTELEYLYCSGNKIQTLDLGSNEKLKNSSVFADKSVEVIYK